MRIKRAYRCDIKELIGESGINHHRVQGNVERLTQFMYLVTSTVYGLVAYILFSSV